MRVLMMVQLVDEQEWLRGFTVGWIRALAAQVERVEVITLEMGEASLPENVHVQSMGKERGYGRAREMLEFYRALGRVIGDVDVLFSHMTPRYTWLAAPFAALYRKPQMMWFTHRQKSPELRMALACSRWATTATHDSFPIQSPKVHVMGHGIDTDFYAPGDSPRDDVPLVLAVGRVTPIKYHHILLEAAGRLRAQSERLPVRFAIVGGIAAPGDEAYREQLLVRREALGLGEEEFAFLGTRSPQELLTLYRRATVVTNLTPAGSFDKAVLEAMLTETPVIVSIPSFDDLLGDHQAALRIDGPEDVGGLVARLTELLTMDPAQRARIGSELRIRAAAEHGVDGLMSRIVALMREPN